MSREEQKLLGAMKLFEALSGVDEELLAKADADESVAGAKEKKRILGGSKVRLASALAVAASLFLAVGALWAGMPMLNGKKSAETATMTMKELVTMTADSAADITEELAEEALQEGTLAEDAFAGGTLKEEAEIEAEGNGSVKGNSGNRAEEMKGEKDVITDVSDGMKPDDRVELTEEQARATEGLGSYIPTNLPEGYIWETAKAAVNAGTGTCESLFLCWSKGMDSIMITISFVDPADITLTDITKKETYDVSLYEIPYAETVPEEYRQSFDNPVFGAGNLSLELIKSRMKVVADSGDTDTPRGNFSIIYPEGILLDFNGDGTAEEIWEMLR